MTHGPVSTNIFRLGAGRPGAAPGRAPTGLREIDRLRIGALVEAASERSRLYAVLAHTSRRIELQVALAGTLACLVGLGLEVAIAARSASFDAPAILVQILALAGPLAFVARSASHGLSSPEVRAACAAARARCIAELGGRLEGIACCGELPDGERARARASIEVLLAGAEGDLAALPLLPAARRERGSG